MEIIFKKGLFCAAGITENRVTGLGLQDSVIPAKAGIQFSLVAAVY
jgi:hypothetical protein